MITKSKQNKEGIGCRTDETQTDGMKHGASSNPLHRSEASRLLPELRLTALAESGNGGCCKDVCWCCLGGGGVAENFGAPNDCLSRNKRDV
jgi:hypothetical protein